MNTNANTIRVRQFGAGLIILSAALSVALAPRLASAPLIFILVSLGVLWSLTVDDSLLQRLSGLATLISAPLFRLTTMVILAAVFFVIVTPVAFVLKLVHYRPLQLVPSQPGSHWHSRATAKVSADALTKQF